MSLQAQLNNLVFETNLVRYEPPEDFYNPFLKIATHKTAPRLHEQKAVKRRSLASLLNSKKRDPRRDKNESYLNTLQDFEKDMEPVVNPNAPLKTYEDLRNLRE